MKNFYCLYLKLYGNVCPHFTDNYKHTQYSVYALHSAYIPGLPFVTGSEAIVPQDMFLPGVGVEGVAAPSTEDTLVLL